MLKGTENQRGEYHPRRRQRCGFSLTSVHQTISDSELGLWVQITRLQVTAHACVRAIFHSADGLLST